MKTTEFSLETSTLHSEITDSLEMPHSSDAEEHFTESLDMSTVNSIIDDSTTNTASLDMSTVNSIIDDSTTNTASLDMSTVNSTIDESTINTKFMDRSTVNSTIDELTINTESLDMSIVNSAIDESTINTEFLDMSTVNSIIDDSNKNLRILSTATMPTSDTGIYKAQESSTANLLRSSGKSTPMPFIGDTSRTEPIEHSSAPIIQVTEPKINSVTKVIAATDTAWSKNEKAIEDKLSDNQNEVTTTELSPEFKKFSLLTSALSENVPETTNTDFQQGSMESTTVLNNKTTHLVKGITTEFINKFNELQHGTISLDEKIEPSSENLPELSTESPKTIGWNEAKENSSSLLEGMVTESIPTLLNREVASNSVTIKPIMKSSEAENGNFVSKIQTMSPLVSLESDSEELLETGVWSTLNIDSSGNFAETTEQGTDQRVSIYQTAEENTSEESGMSSESGLNSGDIDDDEFPTLQPTKMEHGKTSRTNTKFQFKSTTLGFNRESPKMPGKDTFTFKSPRYPSLPNVTYRTSKTTRTTTKNPDPNERVTRRFLPGERSQMDTRILAGVLGPLVVLFIIIAILGFVYYRKKKKMRTYTISDVESTSRRVEGEGYEEINTFRNTSRQKRSGLEPVTPDGHTPLNLDKGTKL
ncbi:uncharacterized protein LOC134239922 [Saccostrea cucullata]|uniref:uncharacterized protein LOC134239922 n=1 Tax=Saccostrea cuccullata TaxID=36930 RepID=UPI002ED15AB4